MTRQIAAPQATPRRTGLGLLLSVCGVALSVPSIAILAIGIVVLDEVGCGDNPGVIAGYTLVLAFGLTLVIFGARMVSAKLTHIIPAKLVFVILWSVALAISIWALFLRPDCPFPSK